MVRNVSRRAWRLKRNGLIALGPGVAAGLFLIMMWLGAGFTFTRFHGLFMVVAAGLLITAIVCLLASFTVQDRAVKAAEAANREVDEAERRQSAEFDRRAAARADARRAVRAQELPLDEWDDAITTVPRPQPEGSVRPELRRGPRQATQAPRSPALSTTTTDSYAQ